MFDKCLKDIKVYKPSRHNVWNLISKMNYPQLGAIVCKKCGMGCCLLQLVVIY